MQEGSVNELIVAISSTRRIQLGYVQRGKIDASFPDDELLLKSTVCRLQHKTVGRPN